MNNILSTNITKLKKQHSDFDYNFYKRLYPDIYEKYKTPSEGLFHYVKYGINENRIKNLNELIKFNKETNILIEKQTNQLSHINIENPNHFHILTRTNKRPTYFDRNYNIIISQQYPMKYINHIVSYHNNETYEYLNKYPIKTIKVKENIGKKNISVNNLYPYNLYLNNLVNAINNDDSWIIFIDDDDLFTNNYCLTGINHEINKFKQLSNNNNFILFWRVFRCDQLTGQTSYNQSNINLNIGLCGFCIHSSNKHLLNFTTNKIAYTIKEATKYLNVFWSEYIYTKIGNENSIAGFGATEF